MVDEITLLKSHRPKVRGPDPSVTKQARDGFAEFVRARSDSAAQPSQSGLWTRRWVVIVAALAALLAASGIAVGIFGEDGVAYTEDPTEITTSGGLALIVRESNVGTCVEVQATATGDLAGGCGADLGEPLGVAQGFVGGVSFVSGWTSVETAEVVIEYGDGERLSVNEFVHPEGYAVKFFVVPVDGPSEFELRATAFDNSGGEVGSVALERP